MATNRRKRNASQVSASPTNLLKPLQGAQIEAVTTTYNELRAAGVDSHVDFPATVVAGDTSSGKSSVMTRLTGLPFPRGEGVVTKFATEVDMMPADIEEILVSIRPDKARPEDQQATLLRFRRQIEMSQFEETFHEAGARVTQFGGRTLYADILHISLKGPHCCPLTVIDLPGLIHAATQKVSEADGKLSEELTRRYISENRTIVLAVISASNDVVNQAITRITREFDRRGARTMGIVTKVDTVCGKAKDNQLLSILSDEEIPLQLGWHALVNTIEDDNTATDQQIKKAEEDFFKAARFKKLNKSSTGIDNLRARVVRVVGEKLVNTLPALRTDAANKLSEAETDLYALGNPMTDLSAQRKLLMQICARFEKIAQNEIDGVFFSDSQTDAILATAYKDTLRCKIDKIHHDFASAMRAYGGTKDFRGLGSSSTHAVHSSNVYKKWSTHSIQTERNQAVAWVVQMQQTSSSGGLSGSANNQIVAQLFRELARKWADLARIHLINVVSTCKTAISEAMMDRSTSYADGVAAQIEKAWILPHLDAEFENVQTKLNELETDTFMTLQAYTPRLEALKDSKLKELRASDASLANNANGEKLVAITNLMHVVAYYEVDLESWVSAVIKQVVERFVRCIPKALSPDMVLDLENDHVKAVMTEPEELTKERKLMQGTKDTLEFALVKLEARMKCLR